MIRGAQLGPRGGLGFLSHGTVRVVRGIPALAFGPIDDEEITQVDGVPVVVGPGGDDTTSPDFIETTPLPVLVVDGPHVFWGRRAS